MADSPTSRCSWFRLAHSPNSANPTTLWNLPKTKKNRREERNALIIQVCAIGVRYCPKRLMKESDRDDGWCRLLHSRTWHLVAPATSPMIFQITHLWVEVWINPEVVGTPCECCGRRLIMKKVSAKNDTSQKSGTTSVSTTSAMGTYWTRYRQHRYP